MTRQEGKDITDINVSSSSSSRDTQIVQDDNDHCRTVATATAEELVTDVGGLDEKIAEDIESLSPRKKPLGGREVFLASRGAPPVVHDGQQRGPPIATAAGGANALDESIVVGHHENIPDVESALGSFGGHPETALVETTTAPPPSTTPIWDAYLVPEPRGADAIDAIVLDDTEDIRRPDMRKVALLFGEFLLVGAVIAISLLWMRDKSGDRSAVLIKDPAPSPSPTTILSSTSRFADIVREIMTHFDSPTLIQDLRNPKSPQYRAALWMAEEDDHPATANLTYPLNQTSLDLLQFRQRYALVTFYYATDGDGWKNLCNFLTPSLHVCDWNCRQTSPVCYTGCEYRTENNLTGVTCGWTDDTDPVLSNLVTRLELGKCAGCIGAQLTAWSLLI